MSERIFPCPRPDSLSRRLALPHLIPACVLDLPPHKGRLSRHRIFQSPCESHRFEQFTLPDVRHPLATQNDAPYRLFLATPRSKPPSDGWPVLYMLDGNAAFDFLTAEMLESVPELVIVGIGQETDQQFERIARARDLTFPAKDQVGLRPDSGYGNRPTGGAPQFIPLLLNELRNAAETGLAINPSRRSVWGHSLAGLFVLTLMRTAPASFARFAAISPSLWWHPERFEAVMDDTAPTDAPLYLGSGNREKRSFTDGPPPTDAPESFYDLINTLSSAPEADVSWQVYDGAQHIASLPSSLQPSLTFAATTL